LWIFKRKLCLLTNLLRISKMRDFHLPYSIYPYITGICLTYTKPAKFCDFLKNTTNFCEFLILQN
jgi:hypothetical protein